MEKRMKQSENEGRLIEKSKKQSENEGRLIKKVRSRAIMRES